MLGQRLSSRRLPAHVLGDGLLRIRRRERAVELGLLTLVEHQREDAERELRVVIGQSLRLRRQEPELQLSAALHRVEIKRLILVSLTLDSREASLESFESLDDLLDARHILLMIDARSTVNAFCVSRSLCDAAQKRGESTRIDGHERTLGRAGIREIERGRVKSLVVEAIAVFDRTTGP